MLIMAAKLQNFASSILAIYTRVEQLGIVNGYGLFRVMTKERAEIVIDGSENRQD